MDGDDDDDDDDSSPVPGACAWPDLADADQAGRPAVAKMGLEAEYWCLRHPLPGMPDD